MKKENIKQKPVQSTEEPKTECKKNKAERCIICLCWLLGALIILPVIFIVAINFFGAFYPWKNNLLFIKTFEFFMYWQKLIYILLFVGIIFSSVLYVLTKKGKISHIARKYYRNLLILLLIFFLILKIFDFTIDYFSCDCDDIPPQHGIAVQNEGWLE